MPISYAEYLAMQARLSKQSGPSGIATPVIDEIGELHDGIIRYCKSRMWYYIYSRPDRPSTVGVGAPDFVIFADGGRVLVVECKSGTGKQSTPQKAVEVWLSQLGHTYHLVRSMEEFYLVAKGANGS